MTVSGPDERLSAYYDGELSAAERAEVERLLAESLQLRNQLGGMEELSQRLSNLAGDLPEFDLRASVQKQIESMRGNPLPSTARTSTSRYPSWMPVLLTACSLVLLAAVMLPLMLTSDQASHVAVSTPGLNVELKADNYGLMKDNAATTLSYAPGTSMALGVSAATEDSTGPSVLLAQLEKSRGLKPGEIISRMTQSGETAMLAEYTVVDVRRTAQDVEVLLLDHGIQPLASYEASSTVAKSSSGAKATTTSMKMYLVDAESESLNTAMTSCQSLQEVVASNVRAFSCPPSSNELPTLASTTTSSNGIGYPLPALGSDMTNAADAFGGRFGEPVAKAAPGANTADRQAEAMPQRNQPLSFDVSSTKDEERSSAESSRKERNTPTAITGNSLVIENGEAVYAELQHIQNLPQNRMSANWAMESAAPASPSVEHPAGAKAARDLKAVTRPEAQQQDAPLGRFDNFAAMPQQAIRSRQRVFFVLRSKPLETAAPVPPPPPEATSSPE